MAKNKKKLSHTEIIQKYVDDYKKSRAKIRVRFDTGDLDGDIAELTKGLQFLFHNRLQSLMYSIYGKILYRSFKEKVDNSFPYRSKTSWIENRQVLNDFMNSTDRRLSNFVVAFQTDKGRLGIAEIIGRTKLDNFIKSEGISEIMKVWEVEKIVK